MIGANQRVVVLCDADNLEIEEGQPRRRIGYRKLLDAMNGRELVRAIYYRPTHGFSEVYQSTVERAGFEVRRTYKNSDSWFIADAFAFANKFDVIAFVGGDGDLEPVVPMLKARGVRVEVWSWNDRVSQRVRALVDKFVPLDDFDILMPRKSLRKRAFPNGKLHSVSSPNRNGQNGDIAAE